MYFTRVRRGRVRRRAEREDPPSSRTGWFTATGCQNTGLATPPLKAAWQSRWSFYLLSASEHPRPGDAKTFCQVFQVVTDAAVEFEENQHIRKPAERDRAQKDEDVSEGDDI